MRLIDEPLEQAPDLIPGCISGIAEFWRRKARHNQTSISLRPAPGCGPFRAATKLGRNDPRPCGSGRKFKKCCGAAGNVGGPVGPHKSPKQKAAADDPRRRSACAREEVFRPWQAWQRPTLPSLEA